MPGTPFSFSQPLQLPEAHYRRNTHLPDIRIIRMIDCDRSTWGTVRNIRTDCVKTEPTISLRGLGAALNKRWMGFLILGLATAKIAGLFFALYTHFNPEDFSVYYASGFLLRNGVNPYAADLAATAHRLGLETGFISQATDPPTFLLAFEPLTLMEIHRAYWVWQWVNLMAFAGALVLLFAPRFSNLPKRLALTLVGLAMIYAPVGNNFAIAQNKVIVLFLLAAMMRSLERKYDGWAGLFLALAGLMRVFPLLLGFYLLFKRRWRALSFMAGGLVAGGVLTIAALGLTNSLGFLNSGVNFLTEQRWYLNSANIAIAAVVSRVFWYLAGASLAGGLDIVRRIAIGMADAVLLFALFSATTGDDSEDADWRILSFWVAASVALSPTAWFHYLVLMLIPVAQMAEAVSAGRASARCLGMAGASFILTALIGDTVRIFPACADAIKQLEFVCLLMMIVASYWFCADTVWVPYDTRLEAIHLQPQRAARS